MPINRSRTISAESTAPILLGGLQTGDVTVKVLVTPRSTNLDTVYHHETLTGLTMDSAQDFAEMLSLIARDPEEEARYQWASAEKHALGRIRIWISFRLKFWLPVGLLRMGASETTTHLQERLAEILEGKTDMSEIKDYEVEDGELMDVPSMSDLVETDTRHGVVYVENL